MGAEGASCDERLSTTWELRCTALVPLFKRLAASSELQEA